ncbi:MAG: DUF433 domain-containing protein [Crocosphaera sp.]|nr:DUF433 domain-containing protein [Crocosphaera sp.]
MKNLEDYFNILTPNDIRLKGSRMGIETILYEYIYGAKTAEEISKLYPTITLEQIYATILYYFQNQEAINQYMSNWLEYCLKSAQKQDENPPEYILKIRKLRVKHNTEINKINEYSVPN